MSVGLLLSSVASSGGGAPPPPPPSDANWANVRFLSEFNPPIDRSNAARSSDILGEVFSRTTPARGSNSVDIRNAASSIRHGAVQFQTNPALTNEDFTIEAWFNNPSEPIGTSVMYAQWSSSAAASNKSYHLYWDSTNNRWNFEWSTDGLVRAGSAYFHHATFSTTDNDGVTMAQAWDGEWHHIAVTRADTVITVFVDGFAGGTVSTSDTIGTGVSIHTSTASDLRIGARQNRTERPQSNINAFLDDLRITVGTARYTGAFTPPAGAYPTGASDAHWSEVEVLLDFNSRFGLWAAGKIVGPIRGEPTVAVPIITTKGWQGTASSNGDAFFGATTTGETWSPIDADFTIELFGVERKDATTAFKHIAGCYNPANGSRSFAVGIVTGTSWGFLYSTTGNDALEVSTGRALTQDVAYDLCVERSGTNLRFYENGVLVHTATSFSATIFDANASNIVFSVAAAVDDYVQSHANNFNGFVKAVRYTKGVARYEGAYTVPELPLPIGADYVFPVITDSRWRVRILTFVGSAARISELEFRTTIGGAETASGGFAFSSMPIAGSYAPGQGFDGISTTSSNWRADSSDTERWLAYDFLATKVVTQIALSTNSISFSPTTFVVEKSDDNITWTAVTGTITAGTWTANVAQLFTLADHPV